MFARTLLHSEFEDVYVRVYVIRKLPLTSEVKKFRLLDEQLCTLVIK